MSSRSCRILAAFQNLVHRKVLNPTYFGHKKNPTKYVYIFTSSSETELPLKSNNSLHVEKSFNYKFWWPCTMRQWKKIPRPDRSIIMSIVKERKCSMTSKLCWKQQYPAENLLTSDSNLTPPAPPYHILSLAFNGRLPIDRVHEAETPLIATICRLRASLVSSPFQNSLKFGKRTQKSQLRQTLYNFSNFAFVRISFQIWLTKFMSYWIFYHFSLILPHFSLFLSSHLLVVVA